MPKFGDKVVNLYHKKLDLIMFSKIKTFFKSIRARLKDKLRNKNSKKMKMEAKSNPLKRKRNDKAHSLFI